MVRLDSNNNDYPTHLDSTVYSINNIIINIVSFNLEQTLDMPSVIKFKEEFVNVISPFIEQ